MSSDSADAGRVPGRRPHVAGFRWVSSSPSPAEVARLEETFPEIVSVPTEELAEEVAVWQQRTVIVQSFHRWIPAEALIREFRRAGVAGDIVPISLAFRCHLFRFESPDACTQVLQRPWVVNGQVIATEAWRPQFSPSEGALKSALIWVRLPNLPLEFWREGFLRAIMEPAGEFVSVDAATLARNRGGFARVCMRLDLTRPLRPGVRVQGPINPFWQGFVYECLEGVCMGCGTMNLGVQCSCSVKKADQPSASDQAFGPWLVAVRQRSSATGLKSDDSGLLLAKSSSAAPGSFPASLKGKQGTRVGSSAQESGWSTPAKPARRRSLLSGKEGLAMGDGSGSSGGVLEVKTSREKGVPVSKGRAGSVTNEPLQLQTVSSPSCEQSLNSLELSKNPFASLAQADGADNFRGSRDAFPGAVKRARPEVSSAPRSLAKSEKRKGKGKVSSAFEGRLPSFSSFRSEVTPGSLATEQELIKPQSLKSGGCSMGIDPGGTEGLEPGFTALVQPIPPFETECDMEGSRASWYPMSDDGPRVDGVIEDSTMMEDHVGSQTLPGVYEDSSLEC